MKYLFVLALALFIGACSSSSEPPITGQEPLPNDVRPSWTVTHTELPPDSDPSELETPEITHTNLNSLLDAAVGEPGPTSFYDQAWLLIAHGYRNNLTQVFPAPDVILEFAVPWRGSGFIWAFDGCQLQEGEFTLDGQSLTSATQFINTTDCFFEQYDAETSLIYEDRSLFFLSTLTGLSSYELVNDLLVLTSAETGVLVLQWLGD